MPQNIDWNQVLNIFMDQVGRIIQILQPLWPIISFVVKIWVYFVYFIPVLGMKLLKFLGLWPTIWPFN
jgi:hypothetical protein